MQQRNPTLVPSALADLLPFATKPPVAESVVVRLEPPPVRPGAVRRRTGPPSPPIPFTRPPGSAPVVVPEPTAREPVPPGLRVALVLSALFCAAMALFAVVSVGYAFASHSPDPAPTPLGVVSVEIRG
ncbi:MAG: hypothetical protein KC656_00910 [Myxococcales bacterium]|nr:hypothetical protein [Myxococcales bacterium]MCB9668177.1 hypothetical protein [Alphaproteobacteria bacterium]MCB9692516.1 hypothetical protein [Alphaproteobacteria bacterium]